MDYLNVMRQLPGLFVLLEPREPFVILDASDEYLRTTFKTRDEVVGRPLFDVFPDNPDNPKADGVSNIGASLRTVVATREAHTPAVQRFDVIRPERLGGGFEERWWSACNTPILDADGNIEVIVHRVQEATELVRLRTSEARALRATEVLESITEGFFSLDREYRFEYVNAEAERILERSREDLAGRTIWEVYPGVESSEFGGAYTRAMNERKVSSLTAYYEDHQRWYEAHAYPAPNGIAVYFRDVTEQRRAQDEFHRLAAESDTQRRTYEVVLNNTPDLIFIFALDHRFLYANGALLTMWGKTAEEALGRTTWELGYPDWQAAMHDAEIEQVIATRKAIHGEVPFEGTTGRRVWDYIFAPVIGAEGDVVAIAGTARDTTERRTAEEAIAAQAAKLREADRAKDEFIATLSHELRNPLAPLRNSVAVVRMTTQGNEQLTRLGAMMERQINHLVRLVDDLLEISRINRGDFALRRERTPLGPIVRNAMETCAPVLQARKHVVNVTQPAESIWVNADPVRLAQVISNLVDNAAKYTPDGGRIDVSLSVREGDAAIVVRDNGTGISPDGLDHVFEMFNRGDRMRAQGDGGLGIGLALAKRLAEMHGGSLSAASEGPGRGSEFTVRIPLSATVAPAASVPAPRPSIGRKRILVVDDNRDAADTLGLVLRELGAEVRVAHGGAAALDAFPAFRPAAVLLDIGMPEMDGYAVARELRTRFPGDPVSLIALTGWGQEQDRVRARDAGFDHHIVKPADLKELQDLLASV